MLLFCCCIGQVWGQNFTPLTLDTTLYGHPTVSIYGDIPIQNNTFSYLNMRFEEIELSIPNGWQTSYCLGLDCLPIGITSKDFTLAVSSPDNYVNTHFYPNGIAGTGYVKLKIYEVFYPGDSVILTYHGVAGQITSVHELEEQDVVIFPNPTSDYLTLLLPNDEGTSMPVQIFDALGRLVQTTVITESINQLDLSRLEKGMYIVAAGNIRKKILKQ